MCFYILDICAQFEIQVEILNFLEESYTGQVKPLPRDEASSG